jgi:hypothetical protein
VIPTSFTSGIFIIGGHKMVELSEDEVVVDEKLTEQLQVAQFIPPPSTIDE